MPSAAQIAANRANAKRSTGPRTQQGKARSRYNGIKHGLYARDAVLPGDDIAAFDDLRAELRDTFRPQGRHEKALVERLAGIYWRLNRAAAAELDILDPGRAEGITGTAGADARRGVTNRVSALERRGRREARLEDAFHRVAMMLERRQAFRRRKRKRHPR